MIKAILQRIRVDWGEFWDHTFRMWDERRDAQRITKAIEVAQTRTAADGKKRYVMRDWRGLPWCYTRKELLEMQTYGIMTDEGLIIVDKDKNFIHYDSVSIAVITKQGVELIKKKKDGTEKGTD